MKSVDRGRARADSRRTPVSASTSARAARTTKSRSGRESIESFVVVFVSFLIWSLEAEGFVIPTGSMAPTLWDATRKLSAPSADTRIRSTPIARSNRAGRAASTGRRVESGTCENCRFETAVGDAPSFSGDRIYVDEKRTFAAVPRRGGPGQARAVGRGRLQATRRARGALHQAAGRHAQRGDPDRRRRPLGPAAGPIPRDSSGCCARSTISRPCR